MVDTKNLAPIGKLLIARNETVAVAESVTSGLLMVNFSLAKNATSFFQGGITAYNLGQKTKQLNVDPIYAESTNSVSDSVAQTMASEVADKFCSQWGIGITGYAAPVPELKILSCFSFYAFSFNGEIVLTRRIETKLKGQARVQQYFTSQVLASFHKLLKSAAKST